MDVGYVDSWLHNQQIVQHVLNVNGEDKQNNHPLSIYAGHTINSQTVTPQVPVNKSPSIYFELWSINVYKTYNKHKLLDLFSDTVLVNYSTKLLISQSSV